MCCRAGDGKTPAAAAAPSLPKEGREVLFLKNLYNEKMCFLFRKWVGDGFKNQ